MISDRNIKFLFKLWKAIFKKQETQLLYFIAYHSQTDDTIKKINQKIEIILKHFFSHMNNSADWHKSLLIIQAKINMIISSTMKVLSYEFMYELKLLISLNLVMKFLQIAIYSVRMNAHEAITYVAIKMKKMYNRNYKSIFFKSENKIIFKFYKKYIIAFIKILEFKIY